MTEDIDYDAALAAAMAGLEMFDSSPDAHKYVIMSKFTFIILHAIKEARRLHAEAKHAAEPSVN